MRRPTNRGTSDRLAPRFFILYIRQLKNNPALAVSYTHLMSQLIDDSRLVSIEVIPLHDFGERLYSQRISL